MHIKAAGLRTGVGDSGSTGLQISRKNKNLLPEECDDVTDQITLFLQLVICHHWHDFVIVFG